MSNAYEKHPDLFEVEKNSRILEKCLSIPALGIILATFSGVSFALTLNLVKLSQVFPLVVLLQRSILQFLVFLAAVIYKNNPNLGIPDRRAFFFINLSAIFGSLFPIFCHSALYFIPVPDVVALFFASPAFITLFSCIAFRENPGVYRIFILGLALGGVVVVTKPVFIFGSDKDISDFSWVEGCLLALAASIFYSGFCLSCNFSKDVPLETLNFIVSAYTIVFNVPTLIGFNLFTFPACGVEAIYAMTSAMTGTVAVLLLILATKIEKAGPVAIGTAAELPAVLIFQMVLTSDIPSWYSFLGSALIISSVLISGWLKLIQERKTVYSESDNVVGTKLENNSIDLSLLDETIV